MVRILNVETSYGGASQIVNLFCDDKSEITDVDMETGETDMEIEGWDNSLKLTQGCSAMTANAEMAFLTSDGTWNWT